MVPCTEQNCYILANIVMKRITKEQVFRIATDAMKHSFTKDNKQFQTTLIECSINEKNEFLSKIKR